MRRVIATLAVAAAVLAAGGAAAPGALAAPDGGGQSAAPLLIGMVSGSGEAMVKQDMDSPWNDEHSDVEQVAVAGDPTNGPLVGIVTGSRGRAVQGGQPDRAVEPGGGHQRAGHRRGQRRHPWPADRGADPER
jgi:hypothetical protein